MAARSSSETKKCQFCGTESTFAWLSTSDGHKLVAAELDSFGRVVRNLKKQPVAAVPTVWHHVIGGGCINSAPRFKVDAVSITPNPTQPPAPTTGLEALIATAIGPYLKTSVDRESVASMIETALDARQEDGPRPIQIGTAPVLETQANDHEQMPLLAFFASLAPTSRSWPYLYGPSGTGKSHAVIRYSEMTGRKFYLMTLGPATMKSDIFGFMLPNGTVLRTQFREAWEHGGNILADEMDQCNPESLVLLGGALANGFAAFPDRLIPRHPDCLFFGTGNTTMRGGTKGHEGRRKLDISSQDRFAYIFWPRDVRAEKLRVKPVMGERTDEFFDWLDRVRGHIDTHRPEILSSQRGSIGIALALATKPEEIPTSAILDAYLFRGIGDDVRRAVLSAAPLPVWLR